MKKKHDKINIQFQSVKFERKIITFYSFSIKTYDLLMLK